MKKIAIIAFLLVMVGQNTLKAQEQEPLVFRIIVDWTLAGALGGMGLGAAIWLLDPGNPNNNLSVQLVTGAAWGGIGGTLYSFFVFDETARGPGINRSAYSPLDQSRRISSDPIGDEEKRMDLIASLRSTNNRNRRVEIPLFQLRF